MKQLLCLVSALALVCACCVPALGWADDENASSAASTATDSASSSASAPPETVRGGATSVDTDEGNTIEPTQRADSSFIYDTTIGELAENAAANDKQTVQVTGEVVGDKINDATNPAYCWITLTVIDEKDSDSISVYMTVEDADAQIDTYGRYNQTGTTLQVQGEFHQVCDEHDGALDLHATSVSMTQKGKTESSKIDPMAFFPGIMLVLLAGVLTGIFQYIREKMR